MKKDKELDINQYKKELLNWIEENKIYYGGRIPNEEFVIEEDKLIAFINNEEITFLCKK